MELAAENGYLDADFQANQIRVDLERYQADVVLHYDTGPRYRFGEVRFNQDVLDPDLLTGYVTFKRGEPLNVNKVLELQNALSDSPYWSRVEVVTRQEQAQGLEVPIEVDLVPAKTMRFAGGLGYGTDTGPRGTAAPGSCGGSTAGGTGPRPRSGSRRSSRASRRATRSPAPIRARTSSPSTSATQREDTDTSRSETRPDRRPAHPVPRRLARGALAHLPARGLRGRPGRGDLEPARARRELGAGQGRRPDLRHQRLPAPPRHPGRGGEPALGLLVPPGQRPGQGDPQLGERNRIIGRAEVGYTETDEFRELPPRFRFFAGGDQSVRGFGYQELGREDEAGNVIGGESPAGGEPRVRDRGSWRSGASPSSTTPATPRSPSAASLDRGAGVGLRWRSPIGPIRADVAWALSEDDRPIPLPSQYWT